jgi:hypothetical protein
MIELTLVIGINTVTVRNSVGSVIYPISMLKEKTINELIDSFNRTMEYKKDIEKQMYLKKELM